MQTEATYQSGMTRCQLHTIGEQRCCPSFVVASREARCMYRVNIGDEFWHCGNIDKQQEVIHER